MSKLKEIQKNPRNKLGMFKIAAILIPVFLIVIITAIVLSNKGDGLTSVSETNSPNATSNSTNTITDNDLIIPISEISTTAKFYPVAIDGTKMEVLAVKAPDGSIRTAFNACEVCYDSGKGYYKQSGNKLICQNCGNSFTMDKVGILGRGGCNPYSIFEEDKTVDNENITISKEFLRESKKIFANWKQAL